MEQPKIEAVAIDGPAGAGKSTVARAVAERLGYTFVDTGAMYRAVTVAALREGMALADEAALGRVAQAHRIEFDASGTRVFLDGEDVTAAIRDPGLTAQVKFAARAVPVRRELVRQQKLLAEGRPVVMEGRDITTVVLDRAKHKFYLDASVDCRARRRQADFARAGQPANLAAISADIEERDRSDRERAEGPLRRTDEQIYLDTSEMDAEAVINFIVEKVRHG